MKKAKVTCFRYKKYVDFYVSGVFFSTSLLLSILLAFPEQQLVVLIESDKRILKYYRRLVKA